MAAIAAAVNGSEYPLPYMITASLLSRALLCAKWTGGFIQSACDRARPRPAISSELGAAQTTLSADEHEAVRAFLPGRSS